MNNSGRGNWLVMLGLFVVGMAILVGASAPSWNGAPDVNYTTSEGANYYHNLSANVSGFNNDVTFAVDTTQTSIYLTNENGRTALTNSYISSWINITNSSSGNLTINALYNNQTGFFEIPIQAKNITDDAATTEVFEFIINATNDAPAFISSGIANTYSFSSDSSSQSFYLNGSDEENQFPLTFSVVFNSTNCTHGANTGYADNSDCNLSVFGFNVTSLTNQSANISFAPNSSYVGTYWANVSVMDAAINYNCPHSWCAADYNTTNLTTYYSQMVKFTISPSSVVNVSNCTGQTIMEDNEFNCTIIITTPGETDSLTLSSNATFRNGATSSVYNSSWFALDNYSPTASNFNHNVSISVTPTKSEVGNLTINFTVNNGDIAPVSGLIYLYVNFTESNVTLDSISDKTLYENYSFGVNATDRDLLILDSSVKTESLTFASNTSWVAYDSKVNPSAANYSTATFNVDWDSALAIGTGNYSILINVTDSVNNTHNQTFTIQILDESAPEWNSSLSTPVSLVLTEGTVFSYNVSVNVTDSDVGDSIIFYYENVSGEFCSLNSTNFNSTSGIISFTPTDCDVGYHNVTIIASDTKLNSSKQFNFTVNNIADSPSINDLYLSSNSTTITNGSTRIINEGVATGFYLEVDDYDFLIPSGQRAAFYNESFTVDVIATNSSGTNVDLFEFLFTGVGLFDYRMLYNASFTPTGAQADNYTVFINISDVSGASVNRTFYLNISSVSNSPIIEDISNKTVTIHDAVSFFVRATDEEDDRNDVGLNYSIERINVSAPNLTINSLSAMVTFNMSSNSSYAGIWQYNVTATDSDNNTNFTLFWLYVYGPASLVSPVSGFVLNLTENVSSTLNFTINHSVMDNLTYEFWVDSISCSYQNNSNCTYGDLVLRDTANSSGNGTAYGWAFTPNYTDETYDNYKNITVRVYPKSIALNSTQKAAVATNFSFKLNVSHTNHEPTVYNSFGSHSGTYGTSTPITISLGSNFRDYDYSDSYYLQNVTFTVTSDEGTSSQLYAEGTAGANQLPWTGLVDSWSLQLYSLTALEELVSIVANDSFATDTSDPFSVTFTTPSTTPTPTPSSGGGSTTKLKHYSLKLITPQDIIISEKGFIDIPFSIQNNGQIDLRGISLSSFVRFNDAFSDDVKISLGDDYIEELKFGQSEDFTMRITANTQRAGKYKATIFANVTSPKFSDFGDFFVEIKRANESEAEQILLFTDKFVADNPECLELTELLNLAEEAYLLGEYANSIKLAQEVTEACEDAIGSNDQIRYKVEGFVQDNFYYISFATLVIFFIGFVFYIYKRVRFNKSGMDEYV